MIRKRLVAALVLAAGLFLLAASVASAGNDDQKDKGKKAPEVPIVAAIPMAGAIGGTGYYLLSRWRTRKSVRGEE